MRKTLLLSLIFCLSTTSGCMVMEEIDAAAAKMPKTKNSKQEETAVAETVAPKKSALLEQSKQWWEGATSLAPSGVEQSIVRCRLREGTQFMSKDDCLARGGEPRGVSG